MIWTSLPEEFLEILDSAQTEALPLTVSGSSMVPFLVHGRDTVYLQRVTKPLGRGDIVLYQRENKHYVLHRICRVCQDTFSMVGDGQTQVEEGIRRDQILAVVCAVKRKQKLLTPGCFLWNFFAGFWLALRPLRPALLALYTFLKGSK